MKTVFEAWGYRYDATVAFTQVSRLKRSKMNECPSVLSRPESRLTNRASRHDGSVVGRRGAGGQHARLSRVSAALAGCGGLAHAHASRVSRSSSLRLRLSLQLSRPPGPAPGRGPPGAGRGARRAPRKPRYDIYMCFFTLSFHTRVFFSHTKTIETCGPCTHTHTHTHI